MKNSSRSQRGALCALTILLAACGGGGGDPSTPTTDNLSPIANAGDTQTVEAGARVQLDASASRDPDGSVSRYQWSQSDGPTVILLTDDQAQASFVAPRLPDDSQLRFSLSVTDDEGAIASASVVITVRGIPGLALVSISGQIQTSASQSRDSDTNDPFNPALSNDNPLSAQAISNPTTLGGYVNEPGAGAEGRSLSSGDREDFFSVDLLTGQRISLLIAEFQDADADLYLYSPDGELLDFSIDTGPNEVIDIATTGSYLINVSIFSGATNYSLAVGASLNPINVELSPNFVANELIVSYVEQQDAENGQTLQRSMRLRQLGGGPRRARLMALSSAEGDETTLNRRLGKQRYRLGEFKDSGLADRWNTLMSIKRLARSPIVKSVEPNYWLKPQAAVNDDAYVFQWHYPLINVPGAWDTSVGDPSVIVAVIDTGVLAGHPDLAQQLVPGYDFIRDPTEAADGDGIDPNPEETIGGADPAAVNFHGTHVTGTIAARGNNGIGVAGVAYGARVMPLRAINASGGTSYDVNQAIRFAAGLENDSGSLPSRPAQIINLSLAGGGFSSNSQRLFDELRERGIIVVAAAGNESSTTPSFPASYRGVLSVSAVDSQQRLTTYSNTGSQIDIAAPGGDGSVDFNGDGYPDGVLSTGGSDGEFAYTFLSGTSMAAPHVAGVLALMKSVNPALTAIDVERLLREGALTRDLGLSGRDDRYGYGLIDARKALEAALNDIGRNSSSAPRLSASTSALNFGALTNRFELSLSNSGGPSLQDVTLGSEQGWIDIQALNTDDFGLGRYAISIDRSGLAPGIYQGSITADSSANSLSVRVLAAVSDGQASDLGQVYLVLYDPDLNTVVAQAIAESQGDGYRFTLPPVAEGSYQLFAGTDLDNDLLICDPGEACGAYLTIDQPLTISLTVDRNDVTFPIEYLVALPGLASADRSGQSRSLPKLERKMNP